MSDPNYPEDMARFNNDPRSPNYDDLTDTIEFEIMRNEMYFDSLKSVGYLREAMGEQEDSVMTELGEALKLAFSGEANHRLRVGDIVTEMIEAYMMPIDEDVLAALDEGKLE